MLHKTVCMKHFNGVELWLLTFWVHLRRSTLISKIHCVRPSPACLPGPRECLNPPEHHEQRDSSIHVPSSPDVAHPQRCFA